MACHNEAIYSQSSAFFQYLAEEAPPEQLAGMVVKSTVSDGTEVDEEHWGRCNQCLEDRYA